MEVKEKEVKHDPESFFDSLICKSNGDILSSLTENRLTVHQFVCYILNDPSKDFDDAFSRMAAPGDLGALPGFCGALICWLKDLWSKCQDIRLQRAERVMRLAQSVHLRASAKDCVCWHLFNAPRIGPQPE